MANTTKERCVPTLEAGDRLTRPEFERRYAAMPPGIKAELIEGVVHLMPSPVRRGKHGSPHFDLVTWLGTYRAHTPGVEGGDNATVRLDLDNEPQPDACLYVVAQGAGQTSTSADDYLVGAPELVAEIAATSANYDLHDKLEAYRRNGVLEYVVWRTQDEALDWFVLEEGRYERLPPGSDGYLKSRVFPGLWLDPAAMLARDLARVLDVLHRGIAGSDHREFVERLGKTKASA